MPKGKLVTFKPLIEEWSAYSLGDGNVLRVKTVLTKVTRLQNADGSIAFGPTGEPLYIVQSQNVVQTLTSSEYKQVRTDDISA
jgi:hypothetical protein